MGLLLLDDLLRMSHPLSLHPNLRHKMDMQRSMLQGLQLQSRSLFHLCQTPPQQKLIKPSLTVSPSHQHTPFPTNSSHPPLYNTELSKNLKRRWEEVVLMKTSRTKS